MSVSKLKQQAASSEHDLLQPTEIAYMHRIDQHPPALLRCIDWMHSKSLHCPVPVAQAARGARLVSTPATLPGRTPSPTLHARHQLPSCSRRSPSINASYIDWADSLSYIACQAPVAQLQLWLSALPPQGYATTCSIPRLGALPGSWRQRKRFRCQHHVASVYVISTGGLTPRLECILPLALFNAVRSGGTGKVLVPASGCGCLCG